MIKDMSTRVLSAGLLACLVEAMTERNDRQELVKGPDGELECQWSQYERRTLLDMVNQVRKERGRLPVTELAVWNAEQPARGHSDYARKYAWYCAELALK